MLMESLMNISINIAACHLGQIGLIAGVIS
jgi:hypothetical protein